MFLLIYNFRYKIVMQTQINNIPIVDSHTKTEKFKTIGQPITYSGHTYQLLEGKEKINWKKRCVYAITALALTILTAGVGLAFHFVQELWKQAIFGTRTIKVYKNISAIQETKKEKADKDISNILKNEAPPSIDYKDDQVEIDKIAKIIEENEIQDHPEEIYTNENLDQILNLVDKTKEKLDSQKKFSELLDKIKEAAKEGEILDDAYLSQKFHVDHVIKPLSQKEQEERRANLRKVINEAYLQRELNEKLSWARGSTHERNILKMLGYQIQDEADYYKKEKIYSLLEEILKKQLSAENYQNSVTVFQHSFKKYALQARLKLVNIISELQFNKFSKCLDACISMDKKFDEAQSKIQMEYPENFAKNILLGKRYIDSSFNSSKKRLASAELKKIFHGKHKEAAKYFHDDLIDPETYEKALANLSQHYDMQNFTKLCEGLRKDKAFEEVSNFYQKWAGNIKSELIQGFEDPNEDLHEGVCWATACRLQMLSQSHPELSPVEFAPHVKISPVDRFRQSWYHSQHKANCIEIVQNNLKESLKKLHTLPAQILKKEGFKEDKLFFDMDYDPQEKAFENFIKNKAKDMQISEGWLRLSLTMLEGGHAINVRFDAERNCVWFTDNNVGFACFEKAGQSFEQSRDQCFEFFKDLMQLHYATTYKIRAYQVTK